MQLNENQQLSIELCDALSQFHLANLPDKHDNTQKQVVLNIYSYTISPFTNNL
jgi:hypothetical protein